MAHLFEVSHSDKTPFSETERLDYNSIMQEQLALKAQSAFIALAECMDQPVLVINDHKQVIFSNAAALDCVQEHDHPDHVLGLRFGEFLGRNHAMNNHTCSDPSICANCNELSAILNALNGDSSIEGTLSVFETTPDNSIFYDVYAVPFSMNERSYALVQLVSKKG
ncbi:MAG: hypothetical protein JW739_07670 [Opitutales bacterium]|nr:hypothetical protein [Opitutales bacterium]